MRNIGTVISVLLFSVPPRVAPFSFRLNAEAGIRIQAACSLEEGDLPVTIAWLKDNHPVRETTDSAVPNTGQRGPSISIRQYDEYSSTLVIPQLAPEHSGNYTCQIRNAARVASHTAPLTVSGTYSVAASFVHSSLTSATAISLYGFTAHCVTELYTHKTTIITIINIIIAVTKRKKLKYF